MAPGPAAATTFCSGVGGPVPSAPVAFSVVSVSPLLSVQKHKARLFLIFCRESHERTASCTQTHEVPLFCGHP